jgi:hypothetical protein
MSSYIYFMKPIGMDGPVKIGCSAKPQERLKALSTWSPFPLEIAASVIGQFPDEKFLHRCFSQFHTHHEWFEANPLLGETIAQVASGATIDEVRASLTPGQTIQLVGENRLVGLEEPERAQEDYQSGYPAYSRRVWWAVKKAGFEPADIAEILDRWAGSNYRLPIEPTPAEFRRLDGFLRDLEPAIGSQFVRESEAA